jgi:hypothetical protein
LSSSCVSNTNIKTFLFRVTPPRHLTHPHITNYYAISKFLSPHLPKHTPRHRPCNNPCNRLPNPRSTNNLPRNRRSPHTRYYRHSHDRNSRREHGPRNRIRRRAQLDLRNFRRLRYYRRNHALRLRRHIRDCSRNEYSSRWLCLRLCC